MIGERNSVAALLRQVQPYLITVHCFAHRLELCYKDTVKQDKLYDSVVTLLMGLYYFYNSPKQHHNLAKVFDVLGQLPAYPTRVGGTRWIGHIVLAMETFLKSYKALICHLENVAVEKKSIVTAAGKARGYLKLCKRADVLGYIHILLDVLKPLRTLSLSLQSTDTTLAEVDEKIDTASDVLKQYKSRYLLSKLSKICTFQNTLIDVSQNRCLLAISCA